MHSTQRRFCKNKKENRSLNALREKLNEHNENEFKFINGLFSFKMDLPRIQGH